jgi:hypothetical protein
MPITGQRSPSSNIVVETRTDICALATVAGFYQMHGALAPSTSGLISAIIEDFCSLLESNMGVQRITDVSTARDVMRSCSLRPTHKRGESLLFNRISRDSFKMEINTAVSQDPTAVKETKQSRRQMLLDSLSEPPKESDNNASRQ